MKGYGFLLDRNVLKAASLFPKRRALTLTEVGLPDAASDSQIVRMAYNLERTIVTANGDDFLREILDFQRQTSRKICNELFGLIVIPNGFEHQRRLISKAATKLRLGTRRLTWHDVWEENLYVRIKRDGAVEIKKFPPCIYCQKLEQGKKI